MDFEKSINYAVQVLTKESKFQIKVVSQDKANFGNVEVSLDLGLIDSHSTMHSNISVWKKYIEIILKK